MRSAKQNARGAIILAIMSLVFLIVFAIIAPRARGEAIGSFSLGDAYGIKYADVNKPMNGKNFKHGFEKTCVAAAMATAIATATEGTNEQAIMFYHDIVKHFGNTPIKPTEVWDYMMTMVAKPPKGYWKYNCFNVFTINYGRSWNEIMRGMLFAGWVVIPVIKYPGTEKKHVVTVYEYDTFDDGSTAYKYVDSDDGYYGLRRAAVMDKKGKTMITFFNLEGKAVDYGEIVGLTCIKVVK